MTEMSCMAAKKILIVEDEEDVVELIRYQVRNDKVEILGLGVYDVTRVNLLLQPVPNWQLLYSMPQDRVNIRIHLVCQIR